MTATITSRSRRVADGPTSFRLRRRAHRVALTAHVLASVGWFGIAVLVAFGAIVAALTRDAALPHSLYQTIATVPWLSIPIGLLSVATGTLLGLGTTYGLVKQWWVVIKMVIAAAVIVTDGVLIARVASNAAASGHASTPIYGATIAHVVLLALATVLSVFKPRARTPWARPDRVRHVTMPACAPTITSTTTT